MFLSIARPIFIPSMRIVRALLYYTLFLYIFLLLSHSLLPKAVRKNYVFGVNV